MDNRLLIQRLRLELAYISKHWDRPGNPLVVMTIKHNMLGKHNREVLLEFYQRAATGFNSSISLELGTLLGFRGNSSHEKSITCMTFNSQKPPGKNPSAFFQGITSNYRPFSAAGYPIIEGVGKSHRKQFLSSN